MGSGQKTLRKKPDVCAVLQYKVKIKNQYAQQTGQTNRKLGKLKIS